MLRSTRMPVLAAALAALLPGVVTAQQGEDADADVDTFDRTPRSCILISRIDRTEAIDDRTIIFHMRGRDAVSYRNYLPRRCPNLARNNRFMYQVSSRQLCDIDTITVLEQFAGRLERGFTCALGDFHPVSREDIEELKLIAEGRGGAIDSEPAEIPRSEEDEAAEE